MGCDGRRMREGEERMQCKAKASSSSSVLRSQQE